MDRNNEQLKSLFASRLAELMRRKDMKQNELARALNIQESTVGKWLLRKSMPRMGLIQRIADYFCVGKSYLLEESADIRSERWILLHLIEALPEEYLSDAINYLQFLAQKAADTRRIEKESGKSETA